MITHNIHCQCGLCYQPKKSEGEVDGIFKASDFERTERGEAYTILNTVAAAERANKIMKAWLERQKPVFGLSEDGAFYTEADLLPGKRENMRVQGYVVAISEIAADSAERVLADIVADMREYGAHARVHPLLKRAERILGKARG